MEHRQVAKTLEFLGWVTIILAFIAGIVNGNVENLETTFDGTVDKVEEFSWAICLEVWFVGLIIGFSMIGFGRLIELLEEVRRDSGELRHQITMMRIEWAKEKEKRNESASE